MLGSSLSQSFVSKASSLHSKSSFEIETHQMSRINRDNATDHVESIIKKLNEPAFRFLTFASMAYDFLKNDKMSVAELYEKFYDKSLFAIFTQSRLQMLGLLLMFFDQCFKVINPGTGRIFIY